MFNNPRYITRGIIADVPLHLQMVLWNMVDTMPVPIQDYLQVFCLSAENGQQRIIHKQEVPMYENSVVIPLDEPLNLKIFVIDDNTHSTMLLASEY